MNKLYELTRATLQDLPRVLRAIADQVEAGDYGEIQMAVLVTEDSTGGVRTFGAGGADYYRGIALLHLGLEHLMAKRGRDAML